MYNNLVTCFDYESKSDIEILLITHNKSFFVSNYTRVKLCSREQLFLILIQVYCYIFTKCSAGGTGISIYFLATFENPEVEEKYFSLAS
jgi:hypothetical protein